MAQQNAQSKFDRFDGYIPVAERVEKFYERFPEGRIVTQIIEHDPESGFVLIRAEVFRTPDDASPAATGHAYEVRGESYVNKTSYIENAETSSVGRALALLGFEVKRGIASREEMEKTTRTQAPERGVRTQTAEPPAPKPADERPARAAAEERPARTPVDERPAPARQPDEPRPAPRPSRAPAPAVEEPDTNLDADIIDSANALGYDAAKVRKWVNQKYGVTGGLESLTDHDKREVLQIFRERAQQAPNARPGRK